MHTILKKLDIFADRGFRGLPLENVCLVPSLPHGRPHGAIRRNKKNSSRYWRAVCGESRTHGSGRGIWKSGHESG